MKRNIGLTLCLALLTILFAACGRGAEQTPASTPPSSQEAAASAADTDKQPASETETPADPSGETETAAAEDVFRRIPTDFSLYSGAGAWSAGLSIYSDGSFSGFFFNNDYDAAYSCDYSGRFTDVRKLDEFTYSMRTADLSMDGIPGDTAEKNGRTVVRCEPYGIGAGDTIWLYLPGKPGETLPEGFVSLTGAMLQYDKTRPLDFYGLYNKEQAVPFWSTDQPESETEKALLRIWKEEDGVIRLERPAGSTGENRFIELQYRQGEENRLWFTHAYMNSGFGFDYYLHPDTAESDPEGIFTITATLPAFAGSEDGAMEAYPERSFPVAFDFSELRYGTIRYKYENEDWVAYSYRGN